ncbi:MAG: TetR/AcrR family transcriptional regulator C-terminal domain-containing protein [Actinobacteria bacterium]|nr:TetR/AcrR family transcriptional regulator C-terminal domain-containing protein [Actinomycetota bacterium]
MYHRTDGENRQTHREREMTSTDTASRARLDRRRVLEAALRLVDREGLEALTMRRLGAELGVDPMTVHHHAESKDRLLDGIAELLWEEVALPGGSVRAAEALRTLARSLRDLFLRHPQAAPLILRCSTLPRSALEVFRAYLDVLEAGGIREPAAVLRPVLSYAAGYGYSERSMLGVQCEPGQSQALSERDLLLSLGRALPPATPPELASAAVAMIADCDPDRCFEEGLDLMLAGLAASPGRSRTQRDRDRA